MTVPKTKQEAKTEPVKKTVKRVRKPKLLDPRLALWPEPPYNHAHQILLAGFMGTMLSYQREAASWDEVAQNARMRHDYLRLFTSDNGVVLTAFFSMMKFLSLKDMVVATLNGLRNIQFESRALQFDFERDNAVKAPGVFGTFHLVEAKPITNRPTITDRLGLPKIPLTVEESALTSLARLLECLDLRGVELTCDSKLPAVELAQYAGANGAWFLVGLGYQQRKLLSQVEKVAVGAQRLDEATAVEEHKLVRIERHCETFAVSAEAAALDCGVKLWHQVKTIIKVTTAVTSIPQVPEPQPLKIKPGRVAQVPSLIDLAQAGIEERREEVQFFVANSTFSAQSYLARIKQVRPTDTICLSLGQPVCEQRNVVKCTQENLLWMKKLTRMMVDSLELPPQYAKSSLRSRQKLICQTESLWRTIFGAPQAELMVSALTDFLSAWAGQKDQGQKDQ